MSEGFVLDSFALLAWFQEEKGAAKVDHLLKLAVKGNVNLALCAVNLGEIYYIISREKDELSAKHALTIIDNLPIKIYPADKELSIKAAELKAAYPISYADAFAAALGLTTNGTVVTGDPEFRTIKELNKIDWLDK